jgi:hypothetical protein
MLRREIHALNVEHGFCVEFTTLSIHSFAFQFLQSALWFSFDIFSAILSNKSLFFTVSACIIFPYFHAQPISSLLVDFSRHLLETIIADQCYYLVCSFEIKVS